jgi:hypothetical protein
MTFIIGTPHVHNSGYFRNDDRLSGGTLSEADIQTCTHCQRVIKMQDWRQDGAWCDKCSAPICGSDNPACAHQTALYGCVPFMKRLEQYIDSTVKFQQHLKIAGLDAPVPPQSLIITG